MPDDDGGEWVLVDTEPVRPLGHDHRYRLLNCSCGVKKWCDRTTLWGKLRFEASFLWHLLAGHDPRHSTVQAKPKEVRDA